MQRAAGPHAHARGRVGPGPATRADDGTEKPAVGTATPESLHRVSTLVCCHANQRAVARHQREEGQRALGGKGGWALGALQEGEDRPAAGDAARHGPALPTPV